MVASLRRTVLCVCEVVVSAEAVLSGRVGGHRVASGFFLFTHLLQWGFHLLIPDLALRAISL